MYRSNRRERIKLVRRVVQSMPNSELEYQVSTRFMKNYTELDIREELIITIKKLNNTKTSIKEKLVNAGI